MKTTAPVYGLIAEFADERALVDAARRARAEGYRNIDAYAPFSVEGLSDALGFRKDRVALITLLGGIVGGAGVYFLQWYTAVIDYPINAGGRPLHSWPAFIPATFEMTVLGAALAAFFGMLILNGLPRLNHPIFDAPDFDLGLALTGQRLGHAERLGLNARAPVRNGPDQQGLLFGHGVSIAVILGLVLRMTASGPRPTRP